MRSSPSDPPLDPLEPFEPGREKRRGARGGPATFHPQDCSFDSFSIVFAVAVSVSVFVRVGAFGVSELGFGIWDLGIYSPRGRQLLLRGLLLSRCMVHGACDTYTVVRT